MMSIQLLHCDRGRILVSRGSLRVQRPRHVSMVVRARRRNAMEAHPLFPAMEIRDAIGLLADGHAVDPELLPTVKAAVAGPCMTSDRGQQEFFVNLDVCGQFNVDTEELVWPHKPGFEDRDYVSLRALTNPELWAQACTRWDDRPREWTAFVWRVAVPLYNRLQFVAAWWQQ